MFVLVNGLASTFGGKVTARACEERWQEEELAMRCVVALACRFIRQRGSSGRWPDGGMVLLGVNRQHPRPG